jgi:hypothetical protein
MLNQPVSICVHNLRVNPEPAYYLQESESLPLLTSSPLLKMYFIFGEDLHYPTIYVTWISSASNFLCRPLAVPRRLPRCRILIELHLRLRRWL